jgi:hypothetical protein
MERFAFYAAMFLGDRAYGSAEVGAMSTAPSDVTEFETLGRHTLT